MRNHQERKILFVVNPSSGTGKKSAYPEAFSKASKEEGFQWKVYETTGKDDPEQIRKQIDSFHPERVIAVGGDGTVNMVARELIGRKISLGVIPAGSANGLARNLGIPNEFDEALDFNLRTPAKPIDTIKLNNKYYCLHLSDIGVNARIVKRFEKEGSKGVLGYAKQFFKEMAAGKTSFSYSLEKPGCKIKKRKAEMVVIANASRFGTGVIINPTGKLDDGRFEIVVIKPYPWWFIFSFFYAAFLGRLHRMKYAKIISVKKARLHFEEPQEFQVDGEIIPEITSLEMEILPGALQVVRG